MTKRRSLIIVLGLYLLIHIVPAQEKFATIRILPEDVVQTSIRLVPNGRTNQTAVFWTYTEAGARKMLTFWEEHRGQRAITQVGSFTTPPGVVGPQPPGYATWREGWLKRRTDKFFSVSLEDADKVVKGLKK